MPTFKRHKSDGLTLIYSTRREFILDLSRVWSNWT